MSPLSSKLTFRTAVIRLLLGCGAFLIVAAVMYSLTPWPSDYGLKAKFEFFAEHKDDYDILFFGSSVIYRSIVPEVIEDELQLGGDGQRSRCFNFGNPGMRAFETNHLLKEALALRPARLRWVVVEARHWQDSVFAEHAWTKRAAHWHSTDALALSLESVRLSNADSAEKISMAADHLLHWAWKHTAYGRGTDIVLSLLGIDDTQIEKERLSANSGYRALEEEEDEQFARRHAIFLENQGKFERGVATLERANRKPGTLEGYNLKALESQVAAIRAAGAEPVYIIPPGPPGLVSEPAVLRLLQGGQIPALFVYNDPVKFPRLYSVNLHFDSNHLNRAGAAYFSRILGRDLAALMSKRRSD